MDREAFTCKVENEYEGPLRYAITDFVEALVNRKLSNVGYPTSIQSLVPGGCTLRWADPEIKVDLVPVDQTYRYDISWTFDGVTYDYTARSSELAHLYLYSSFLDADLAVSKSVSYLVLASVCLLLIHVIISLGFPGEPLSLQDISGDAIAVTTFGFFWYVNAVGRKLSKASTFLKPSLMAQYKGISSVLPAVMTLWALITLSVKTYLYLGI